MTGDGVASGEKWVMWVDLGGNGTGNGVCETYKKHCHEQSIKRTNYSK